MEDAWADVAVGRLGPGAVRRCCGRLLACPHTHELPVAHLSRVLAARRGEQPSPTLGRSGQVAAAPRTCPAIAVSVADGLSLSSAWPQSRAHLPPGKDPPPGLYFAGREGERALTGRTPGR